MKKVPTVSGDYLVSKLLLTSVLISVLYIYEESDIPLPILW